jgi:DNA-binding NarL/FixJ family response regulator
MSIRIVVADDHELVRVGYAGLLATQADFVVVGTARDGAEAVLVCREQLPDVVLMDVRMPVMDGIEATARLQGPEAPRVLVLTTFDLDEHVYDALAAGASGFLLKDVTADHLAAAVRLVDTGDALLAPSITRRLVQRFAADDRDKPAVHRDLGALTPRELEVLTLLGHGLSNTELARSLTLSEATVKTHVARIFAKLSLRDRAQAVVLAYETGLVTPGET